MGILTSEMKSFISVMTFLITSDKRHNNMKHLNTELYESRTSNEGVHPYSIVHMQIGELTVDNSSHLMKKQIICLGMLRPFELLKFKERMH